MIREDVTHLVGALVFDGKSILLGLRAPDRRSCPDTWDVPGGHIEAGETSRIALCRELGEELGITPIRIGPAWTIELPDLAEGPARLDLFVVDQWEGKITLCGDEHVALRWFKPSEAAALSCLAVEDYRRIFKSFNNAGAPA